MGPAGRPAPGMVVVLEVRRVGVGLCCADEVKGARSGYACALRNERSATSAVHGHELRGPRPATPSTDRQRRPRRVAPGGASGTRAKPQALGPLAFLDAGGGGSYTPPLVRRASISPPFSGLQEFSCA